MRRPECTNTPVGLLPPNPKSSSSPKSSAKLDISALVTRWSVLKAFTQLKYTNAPRGTSVLRPQLLIKPMQQYVDYPTLLVYYRWLV